MVHLETMHNIKALALKVPHLYNMLMKGLPPLHSIG